MWLHVYGPDFQLRRLLRYWGLGLQLIFLGRHNLIHNSGVKEVAWEGIYRNDDTSDRKVKKKHNLIKNNFGVVHTSEGLALICRRTGGMGFLGKALSLLRHSDVMKESEPGSWNTGPVLPLFSSLDVLLQQSLFCWVIFLFFIFFTEYTQSSDLYYSHCIQLNEIYEASCTECSLFALG